MAARERADANPAPRVREARWVLLVRRQDVLGGWVTGVVAAFLFDVVFVAVVFAASGAQARVAEDRRAWVERRPVAAWSV